VPEYRDSGELSERGTSLSLERGTSLPSLSPPKGVKIDIFWMAETGKEEKRWERTTIAEK